MTRRSEDWNIYLARDLQNPEYARLFLLWAMEDDLPLQYALGKVIRLTGVKEFAAKVGMPSSNVLRAINLRHNPTQATIDRLLKPFGLRLGLAPLTPAARKSVEEIRKSNEPPKKAEKSKKALKPKKRRAA
jgi:DNA-binding phage protein